MLRLLRWIGPPLTIVSGGCVFALGGSSASGRLEDHLSGMMWPLPVAENSRVSSEFGPRGERHHNGTDIRANAGDPVYAAKEGTVVFSGWMRGYGETVVLDHGEGVTTLYAHASARYVEVGDRVDRGQHIAAVGATGNARGNHLHFEISWVNVPVNPILLLPRLRS